MTRPRTTSNAEFLKDEREFIDLTRAERAAVRKSEREEGVERPAFQRGNVSFVRRGDRFTLRQQEAWKEFAERYVLHFPRNEAATSVQPDFRLDAKEIWGREAPLVVEIGCGLGENLAAAAERHPEWNFLGLEVYRPGIAQTLFRLGQSGSTNVRMAQADAVEVFQYALADLQLHEVWIFFPDPWHKTRHHKRRLIKPDFAATLASRLAPGGTLRMATDWAEYGEQMREVADAQPLLERDFSGDNADRFVGRVLTSFEQKGLRKDRLITDLAYKRI